MIHAITAHPIRTGLGIALLSWIAFIGCVIADANRVDTQRKEAT